MNCTVLWSFAYLIVYASHDTLFFFDLQAFFVYFIIFGSIAQYYCPIFIYFAELHFSTC